MQTVSHSTWAYIINAKGLPGFICKFDIIKALKNADEKCQLDCAKQWQLIDLNKIEEEFKEMPSLEDKMCYLGQNYPSVYIFILELLDRKDRVNEYIKQYKTY